MGCAPWRPGVPRTTGTGRPSGEGSGGSPPGCSGGPTPCAASCWSSRRGRWPCTGTCTTSTSCAPGREPWLAIDPKGLAGDPCFDVCQFLRNPEPVLFSVNRARVDVFCAELGLDHDRTRDWCFVHAVLDACWAFEDGEPWQETVAYAEETLRF